MRTRPSSSPRPLSFSLARLSSALAVATVLGSGTAAAQTVFWDPLVDGDGLLGGTGTWNLTNTFWDPTGLDPVLPDNVVWPNAATSIGVFGGTPGTATINTGTGVTANGLTFNVSNYLIASNVAADVLTLAGATPTITVTNAGTTARINSVIGGTAGLTTAGSGTLVLSGANTFTGQMIITPGSIVGLNTATALGANGAGNETIVQSGGMLNIAGQGINNNPPPATPGEEIRIAGTGVGGLGALINTTGGGTNTLAKVVLTADATIGAGAGVATSYGIGGNIVTSVGGRTDIRVNAAPTVGQRHLDLAGFTLTKSGSHLLALVNAEVSDGNIIVNDGQLNIEAGTLVQGTGLITVNPGGKLGFWSSAAGAVTRPIVVNGGTIGDPTASGAAQTISAPISFTGALNPNFTSVGAAANVTTLAGVISQAGFTGTELAKRGSGPLAFSNPANTYIVPNTIHQGTLRGNYTTALPAGGVAPAAPLTTTDTPLGTNPTINIAGGVLSLRINMANDNTNQRWDLGRAIVVDRAPGTMDFDRLSNAAQVDKNVVVSSLTFAAPSAANGYSVGQNQLIFNQGNTHRLDIAGMTMNSDTVLTTGDFTFSGNAVSPGRHSLVHSGGNSWGFIDGTAQQFNAVMNLGAANLRIGSMFGTGVINDTVTAGTGPIYNAPNNVVAFRSPTNIAPGQTVELFSHRTAHSTVNLQNFTSVPASLRALNSGVLGVGSATAFGDIDLSKLGDGTFRIGSGLGGTGNGTIVGVVQPGAGGIVRTGAAGTTLLTAPNAISGSSILEVGSDLINGGFRTAGTGGAQNGTVLLTAANNYTGGTLVNRSSTLRFQDEDSLGSGPITVAGTATAESAADAGPHGTFIGPGPVTFVGGGAVRFVNDAITNAATPTPDRWGDTTPMSLIANTVEMRSRNIAAVSNTTEAVGAISYAGGNIINLQRLQAITDHVVQLNVDSLTRVGQGTIELARSTGTGAGYGAGQRLIVTNGAPTPVNGMVSPWLMGQNNGPNEFLTYGANGFTPITYDTTVTTGTYAAGTLDYNGTTGGKVLVTTAVLTLTDDPTLYALRTEQTINVSGANDTITLRTGGLALRNPTDNTTLIVNPNIVANDGTNNIELVVNTTGGTGRNHQINGTITANGLTKFGVGNVLLNANNAALTGTVAINQGTLQTFGPTATGTFNSMGTGPVQLAGGQLNLRSNNSAVTGTINQTLQNTGVLVAPGIPIATIDVNRSTLDVASTGTFIFNPAAAGPGLQLQGSPGVQGQTLTVSGANYSLQFGSLAQNSFAGNVTINNAVTLTLNAGPTITGTNPVITKSSGGNLIVGAATGSPSTVSGTQVVLNAGTLELRSVISFGTGDQTGLVLNSGTLNLRRDSAGNYGTTGSGTRYPVTVNGNTTISTDRVGGTATNFAEGLGQLTLNGTPVLTFNSGNGIYPEFVAPAGNPAVRLNGLAILNSNVGPGGVDSAVRFNGQVAGGGFVKLGGGHIHLLGADSPYDGGTYINQGIVRARAANALGTGPVFLNPGGVIDFNATNNLRATQPLIVRGNSTFLPMISVNADIPHPTANVDVSGAPLGVIGLSNTPGGTYNTPINMATLYGGNWSLGGISSGAYDARYTAPTLGAGAGNTYRLGGGGLAFVLGVDTANAAQNNVLTGPNNAVFGIDSGNIRGANTTTFQMVVGGTNDYSGGSTLINRGTVTRLTAANDGVRTGLSNSAVNVFGNLVLGSTASLVAGAGNTNAVTLHPGAALHFDNNNGGGGGTGSLAPANVLDRWNDTTPIALNGALVDLIGTTDQVSSETVGDVTYSRGARIRVARGGTTGTATLTVNNLLGAGPGNTLTLQSAAAGTLGTVAGDRLIVTNAPPVPTNGMVSPSIVNATDNTFVTYGANGFANVTYDKTVNATYAPFSLLPTDKVDVVTAALTLNDNPTVYALRTSQNINIGGPFTTMTIRSGGLIGTGGTIQPHLIFNDGTANVEARIYNNATVTINGTLTANGITKFGTGNLTINVPQRQHATGWTVNAGTLQINDLEGLGQSVPGNTVTLNATQTTGGSVAQALGITNLTLNRNTGSPELGIFTSGPITVVNEATIRIAGGDDRNLQMANVTLMSTGASSVGFTFDVPNNRYRGTIPTLTLLNDATIRVTDSGSTADTGRITAGVVNSLVGNNVRLNKIGNRTLELGNNAASFLGGSIVVSQGTVRVLDNGALGSPTTAVTIERNATLEIGVNNFVSTAPIQQLSGSIERWNVENARPAIYNLPAGVNLQLNTNLTGARTIGLNGGSLEGFLWTDHPASAVVRNVGSGVTVNLLANSSVGQNVLQGPGYDAGRQPTVGQPFGDNITGAQLRIDGNITGAFDLTKTGLDTVTLAGTGNTYNNTIVDAGTLRIGATNALPSGGVLTTRLAGTFDLFGFDQTVAGLGTITGGPDPGGVAAGSSGRILNTGVTDNTLRVNNAANYTYNGTIERNVALTKAGAGALTLGGANTYVGDTTIETGTLILTGVISGTRKIDVQAPATFDVSGVPGGYTLGATQTLGGNGNVIGNVNIDGTISPGAGPGTLTLSGSADFNNGSTLALEINSASAFDKLVANGVTLDGIVNLTINLGYVPPASPPTTFLVVDNTSANPIGGTTGLFTWGGPEGLLTEGEHFMVNGQDFAITYLGGVGGNDVLLTVPEPTSATLLLASLGIAAGLQRFRRRHDA